LVDPAPLTASTTKFAKRNRSFPRLNRKISTRDLEHGNDQREKGLNGGEHRQAARVAGKTPMEKWAFIIEPLLRGLESEIADRQGLIRSNIDNKIRETEQIVSEIEPQDIMRYVECPIRCSFRPRKIAVMFEPPVKTAMD
jgi:hypothetical protein